MSFESAYAKVYESLYSTKDYEAEVRYVLQLFEEFGMSDQGRILEIGTGTGVHANLIESLTQLEVFGLEPSESMALQARKKGLHVEIAKAENLVDVYDSEEFDACLALFHVVSYLVDLDQLDLFCKALRAKLRRGGLFIFDVWHRDAVLNHGMEVRVKRVNNDSQSIVRIAEPRIDVENSLAWVSYEVFFKEKGEEKFHRFSEEHNLRYFSKEELVRLFEETRFEFVESHEFLTKNDPSSNTWGVTYVFRAI